MKYKINILSTSRSDYGILYPLIKKIQKKKNFNTKVVISGSHLYSEFGNTIDEIRSDKIKNIKIIGSFKTKSKLNDGHIFSQTFNRFNLYFKKEKPHLLILLGDRFEAMSVALAAKFNSIDIVHLHGGEKTLGSYDDTFRHCITKLSNLHFVSKKRYKQRVIQLGENPKNIFNLGSLSFERLFLTKFRTKKFLEKKLGIKFKKKNYLITLHPETENSYYFFKKVDIFFKFIDSLKESSIFITSPSFDKGSEYILKKIKNRLRKKNVFFIKNAGYENYVSLIKTVDCVIGNSSSGYYEVPALNNFTLDVGERQHGRELEKTIFRSPFVLKKLNSTFQKINKLNRVKKSQKKNSKKLVSTKMIEKILYFLKKNKSKPKNFFDLKI